MPAGAMVDRAALDGPGEVHGQVEDQTGLGLGFQVRQVAEQVGQVVQRASAQVGGRCRGRRATSGRGPARYSTSTSRRAARGRGGG